MVTPQEMRKFAVECMRWSDETDNASHRALMLRVAQTWVAIAAAIERRIPPGAEMSLPDFRTKLD